jgi:hypothetical protein
MIKNEDGLPFHAVVSSMISSSASFSTFTITFPVFFPFLPPFDFLTGSASRSSSPPKSSFINANLPFGTNAFTSEEFLKPPAVGTKLGVYYTGVIFY